MDKPLWKILLVDDDEDDYLLVREMLAEAHGAKVRLGWASTFIAGQYALNLEDFDAVLMDYDLGARTGLDLIRDAVARQVPYPIILLTGRGSYQVDVEAMQAGATMYLTKSEANALLLERVIRYAIEMKQKEAALMRHAELQSLLLEVTQKILAAPADRAAMTRTIFETVRNHLDTDVLFNYQLTSPDGPLKLVAGYGIPEEMWEAAQELALGQAFCGTVAATRQPLAANADRIASDEKGAFVHAMGVRAYACHPLFSRDGRVLGTLSLCSRSRSRFEPDELHFLQTLCHFVALAWDHSPEETSASTAPPDSGTRGEK